MNRRRLENRTALVTGGSRGLGRAIALRLGQEGANVILSFRTQKAAAAEVIRQLSDMGRRATAIQVDLTGAAHIGGFVDQIRSTLTAWQAGLDIAVPSAGIITIAPFAEVSEESLDAQYQTNYKSVFFLLQRLLPLVRDGGRIITIGSGTTHHAFAPLVAYAPMKAAIEALTFYLASSLGERGITVNAVSPGALDTDFNGPLFEAMPGVPGYIAQQTALGRVGAPDDVAGVVAFLCSDDGRWITGHRVDVSGGFKL